jgi:hypothetical protein
MIRPMTALAVCLALAGCASPKERCALNATKEYRTVDNLIAETEGNLARGYAVERVPDEGPRVSFCTGGYGGGPGWNYPYYRYGPGVSFCTTDTVAYRDRPVAIDPAAEQRKLALLKERKARLADVARRNLAACNAL